MEDILGPLDLTSALFEQEEVGSSVCESEYGADYLEVEKVRIYPSKVVFSGAFNGKSFHAEIVVKNCGDHICNVQIGSPNSYAFKIRAMDHFVMLSPGMKVSRKVHYTYHMTDTLHHAQLPIRINSETVNFFMEVSLSKPKIKLEPTELDFGIMNIGQSPVSRVCHIHNSGQKTVTFAIEFSKAAGIDMCFKPHKGELCAKSVLDMVVSVVNAPEGTHLGEFWVKCSHAPYRGVVRVTCIHPKLIVYHINTTGDFTLVDFEPTFYGSQRRDTIIIRNSSAIPCTYLVMVEINGRVLTFDDAADIVPALASFSITPMSGTLNPFEGRIVTLIFQPKMRKVRRGWKHQSNYDDDFLVFLRIINAQEAEIGSGCRRFDSDELLMSHSDVAPPYHGGAGSAESSVGGISICALPMHSVSMQFQKSPSGVRPSTDTTPSIVDMGFDSRTLKVLTQTPKIRMCLHGEATEVDMTIIPNELNFQDIALHETVQHEVCLTNKSTQLPIHYRYISKPNIEFDYPKGILKPKQSVELALRVTPKSAGLVNRTVTFEVLSPNNSLLEDNTMVVVGKFTMVVKYNVNANNHHKAAITKFNPGIIPVNGNEVGANTELTFRSKVKKPRNAMNCVKRCPKHPKNRKDKCLIAFPNDMGRTLRATNPPGTVFRTPFSGVARYSPGPDLDYQRTVFKELEKQLNDNYYTDFVHNRALARMALPPARRSTVSEYDVVCKKVYMLMNLKWPKHPSVAEQFLRAESTTPRKCICIPLTPLQLYRIKVKPHLISFGMVSVLTPSQQVVHVHNFNSFQIKFKLEAPDEYISFPCGDTQYVNARCKAQVVVEYYSIKNGRYTAVMNYRINDTHTFDLSVSADVVKKNLQVSTHNIEFLPYQPDELFQHTTIPIEVKNPLYAFTRFKWTIPNDTCYHVVPAQGVVPRHSSIVCHVYRRTEHEKKLHTELFLVPESGIYQVINVNTQLAKPWVTFKESLIEIDSIPLNIMHIETVVLFNKAQSEATFVVDNPEPMFGVVVKPRSGILQPRSLTQLFVKFLMKAVVTFRFVLVVEVQRMVRTRCTILGTVHYPHITISPNYLRLRRISADSFDRLTFVIENTGINRAHIKINLSAYTEYRLSTKMDVIVPPYDFGKDTFVIRAGHHKRLFLHFRPIDVATYEFYLPIVINDILGPPDIDHPDSIRPRTYLDNYESIYLSESEAQPVGDIPKKLPYLKVVATVATQILRVSTLNLNFRHSPHACCHSVTSRQIVLTNVNRNPTTFLVRTDNLQNSPFQLNALGQTYEITSLAIVQCDLTVDEELTLLVEFKPTTPGIYKSVLPIYVQHYDRGTVFNYLHLKGEYPEPHISSDAQMIYFAPVPLQVRNERKIKLTYSNYYTPSSVRASSETTYFQITFPNDCILCNTSDDSQEIDICISFCSEIPISIMDTITCLDTHGNSCSIKVYGTADNCILTIHEFLVAYSECYTIVPQLANDEEDVLFKSSRKRLPENLQRAPVLNMVNTCLVLYSNVITKSKKPVDEPCVDFPFFPADDVYSDISQHLQDVVDICEKILFERVMCCEYYAPIPEGFHAMVGPKKEPKDPNEKKGKDDFNISIISLLVRFIGPSVNNFFTAKPMPTEKCARVHYIYTLYTQLLTFLSAQGANLVHVEALFMMHHNDFKEYLTEILPTVDPERYAALMPPMPNDVYQRRCKQNWLDVVLQMYKTLFLNRVTISSLSQHAKMAHTRSKGNADIHVPRTGWFLDPQRLKQLDPYDSNIYGTPERILLAWLNVHFEYQRTNMWANPVDSVPPRNICNFSTDLADVLPLIFVTASYCPYLSVHYFQDVYGVVTLPSQAYHNAARLISAWRCMRLGLTVTTENLIKVNTPYMVMTCTFLYTVLPSLMVKNTILFQAPLSQEVTRKISISCATEGYFLVEFVGNDLNYFSVDNPLERIKLNSKGMKLAVHFRAKKIARIHVTMILCGDVNAGTFTQNIVFSLEGEPTPLDPVQTINITGMLYDHLQRSIRIDVPYKGDAVYDIYRTEIPPTYLGTFQASCWEVQKEFKVPRIMHIDGHQLNFVNRVATLRVVISYLIPEVSKNWLVFLNDKVGDFIVLVNIAGNKGIKARIPLHVLVPSQWCKQNCKCVSTKHYKNCPLTVNISIPACNKLMWECFNDAFRTSVKPKELDFWQSRLNTNIGVRLIHWLLTDENGHPSMQTDQTVFKTEVKYTISCDRPNIVKCPNHVLIEDVRATDTVDIPVHITRLCNANIILTSENKKEMRAFYVEFSQEEMFMASVNLET